MIIKNIAKLFTPTKAEEMAETLNVDSEDGWTYIAVHDPKGTGFSFIEIYDEDQKIVGCL